MKNEKLRQGFSLVEVLFTIAFLSVIIFGVIKLQTSNLTLTNAQNNEIKAHFLANQGVEIVEGVGVAGIGACGPPCTKYINFDGSDYSLIDADNNPFEDDFDLTIEIETAGTAGDYLVTAIIEWTDSAGTHNVTDGGAVIAKRIIHNN